MLKEKVHHLSDQLSSSGVVKREHADIRGEVGLHLIKGGIVNILTFTINYTIPSLNYNTCGKNRDTISFVYSACDSIGLCLPQ